MTVQSAYERAKAYVESQLAVDRRFGKLVRLTRTEYEAMVNRIARAIPRSLRNGSTKTRTRNK